LVIYELLLGEKPYTDATTPIELISRQLNAPLPRLHTRKPNLSAALDEVLQTATAKNPDQRYANALRFAAAFQASVSGTLVSGALLEPLTPRELDILRLMVDGLSNSRIAEQLFLSAGTVKWYVNQIYAKLDVHSRAQAIERTRQLNLLTQSKVLMISQETIPPLEGERTAFILPIRAIDLPELANPYKGLRAFQEADAADFFGRAALTEQLLGRLAANDDGARFLAVVGPSGSGKSSVVKAGLIPALRKGAMSNSARWFITDMLPGTHPFEELEAALLRVASSHLPDLLHQLTEDRRGLVRAGKRILPNDMEVELVVVIDQFEELFTMVEDENVRRQFIDSLLAATSDPRSRIRIMLTLRADFYDRPLMYPRLAELMRSHAEVIVPMTASELERAIAGPAERVGLALEPGLTLAMINDILGRPAALPLLQYALSELYERRADRLLTVAAYQESGGISGALARRADELFNALDPLGQAAVRQLFLRLIVPGEGTEDTRRRVLQIELVSLLGDERAMDDLIDLYCQFRLLTLDHNPVTRGPTVEIAHKALLWAWNRLHEWVVAAREELRIQRRLSVAADEWVVSGRDVSYLAAGARLIQFEALRASGTLTLNESESSYLQTSVAERERMHLVEQERQQHELALARQSAQAERRAATRLRYLVGLMILAVILAGSLSAFAFTRQQLADVNAQQALSSAATSAFNQRRAEGSRLAAEANRLLQTNDSAELTTLLAVRSLRMSYSQQADNALQQAILLPQPIKVFASDAGNIGGAVFLPDGKSIFTSGDLWVESDSVARLWDTQTGKILHTYTEISKRATGGTVNLSRNGKTLMIGDKHTIWLFDLQTEQEIRHFEDDTRFVGDYDLSLDGKYLLRGDRDGTVRLFDVQSGVELRHFDGLPNDANHVLFSPDDRYVFTTPERTIAAVWNMQTGQQITRFVGHTDAVYPMALSPDGKYLLTASNDSTARLWDIATGQEVRQFIGHTGSVWSAAYSPDGTLILTGGIDRTPRLWDAATGKELYRLTGANGPVYGLAFSPDGKSLVTGGDGPFARLWSLPGNSSPHVLRGHSDDVNSVAVSPDGAYFVTASTDGTAKIWEAQTGILAKTLMGKGTYGYPPIFSPDGKLLLTNNGTEGDLWSFPDGKLLQSYPGLGLSAVSSDMRRVATYVNPGNAPVLAISDLTGLATGDLVPKPLYTIPLLADAWSVQYSPDDKTILVSGLDSVARLYDAEKKQVLRQFTGHTALVRTAVFSPDGRTMLTASDDKTARLWDVQTGQEIRRFIGHTAFLTSAVFSADGRYVATVSGDSTVRLWDTTTGQIVRTLVGHTDIVFSVAFTPDGKHLITGSRDKTVRIWEVDYHDLVNAACKLLSRDFTSEERTQFDVTDVEPTCPLRVHKSIKSRAQGRERG